MLREYAGLAVLDITRKDDLRASRLPRRRSGPIVVFRAFHPVLIMPDASPFMLPTEILAYHAQQAPDHKDVCDLLGREIATALPASESKIWHGHPVWFLDGNPTVGYSHQKAGIRLMFWSGADFGEPGLPVVGKKFKDASVFYNRVTEVNADDLRRWLQCAQEIQWDYKNIVKRKGRLERLK